MNKKLIALSMATVMLSTTMASDLQQKDKKNEVNAANIVLKTESCDYLKIRWNQDESTVTLSKFEIIKEPDSATDLTLIIPGMIGKKRVNIGEKAFQDIKSEKLRLHLVFQAENGNKVLMPDNSTFMFKESTALHSINFSGASTENVTDMACMFSACENLKELDLTSFNTQNVIDMSAMFSACLHLEELNLSSFNTPKLEDSSYMFDACKSLKILNLSNFDTKNVTNIESMFYGCENLKELKVNTLDMQNVQDMDSIFPDNNKDLARTILPFCPPKINNSYAKKRLMDFRNELNQIKWLSHCSEFECAILSGMYGDKHKWITAGDYSESRRKVIGEAIGDCVAGKNEFAWKNAEDIITFDENTQPESYSKENWNAVILYNYVHEAINGVNLPVKDNQYVDDISDVKKLLNKERKLEAIKNYYEDYYVQLGQDSDQISQILQEAVQDIQQYVDALHLNEVLYDFRSNKLVYDKPHNIENIVSGYKGVNNGTMEVGFNFQIIQLDNSQAEKAIISPTFRYNYKDDSLCIPRIQIREYHLKKDSEQDQYREEQIEESENDGFIRFPIKKADLNKSRYSKWIKPLQDLLGELVKIHIS